MSFGLLRCGMAHSFQKDHHLNANHLFQRTEKARQLKSPLYIMTIIRKFYIFLLLDLATLICWGLTLSPYAFLWKSGPIDAQGGAFFFCLLMLYVLIPASLLYLIYFVYKNSKAISLIAFAFILNIHAFIVFIWFIGRGIIS